MTLTGAQILEYLTKDDPDDRLFIAPMLEQRIDLDEASVDLRLGHYFLLPRRARQRAIDPLRDPGLHGRLAERTGHLHPCHVGMEAAWLPQDGEIVLQPSDFILAATLEYVGLPGKLCAHVMGRSRWARVGLVIQMASFVHPGYRGCLTLEMQNLGSTPIVLRPGYRVAHLVLNTTSGDGAGAATQVVCSIKPQVLPLLSLSDREMYR